MNIIQEIFKTQIKGVEWKELGEVCNILRGKRLTKKELVENGAYPVFHGGLIPLGFYNKSNRKANQTMIINTGSVGEVVWSGVDFWSSDGTFVIEVNDQVIDRFLYFFLKTKENEIKKQKREGGVPTIERGVIEKIKIPIPSFEIQKEIVRILDNFTSLQAELQAELQARKEQYNYYLNDLLTPKNPVIWEEGEIGELCNIIAGGDIPKNNFSKEKTEKFYVSILSNGTAENALYGYTDIEKVTKPSVTISARGTIGWASYQEKPFYPIVRLLVLTPKNDLNVKFLYYLMKNQEDKYLLPKSGIPQLTKPTIEKILIKYPKDLKIQQKIVDVLDNFEKICSDLNIGLPAEIEARQKQYEYYREKLLTFDGKMTQYFINNLANKTLFDKLTSGQASRME